MQNFYRPLPYLERRSKPFSIACGLLFTLLLGLIDYLSGYEFSFAVFYLLPVSVVAWAAGKSAGMATSVICAITWVLVNYFSGQHFTHPLAPYWNALTQLGFFAVVTLLIANMRSSLEYAWMLTRTDSLTSVFNRRAFREMLHLELARASRYSHSLTLIYLDVDNFKAVNDEEGHGAGDALLRKVAETLKQNLRATDVVARLGGDEFAVVLPEADKETARQTSSKLHEKLLETMAAAHWPVTFSMGVLTWNQVPQPVTVDEAIHQVDILMYSVKHRGKNGIRHLIYSELEDVAPEPGAQQEI